MKSKDENKIRNWLGDRYHLNTEITFKEDKTKIEKWKLFRVYPNWMTDGSEPIMTSETHTDEELMNFAKKHRKYNLSIVDSTTMVILAWLNLILGFFNILLFRKVFIRGFICGIDFTIIVVSLVKLIYLKRNEKVEDNEFKENMELVKEKLNERMLKIEKQNLNQKAIISKKVEHQGIGGKEIILEKELLVKDFLDTNLNKMTIAMTNFIKRRLDFVDEKNEDKKVYYGHVGNFGYFVAEDEIEMIENERKNDTRESN